MNPVTGLRAILDAARAEPVVREESAELLVQRRWISSVTLAVGSFMLALTLRVPAGDPAFYGATLALGATWIIGGLLSGKLHLGTLPGTTGPRGTRGVVLQGVALGALLLALFLAGAALVAPVQVLREPLVALLDHARYGGLPIVAALTALVAIGEEIFFRGALYAAVGDRQALLVTTLVYALTTIPSGMPLMVIAAALLGVVAGLQRRITGGVLGGVVTHLIWSLGLLFLLPLALGIA
ncbi:MAG: CPBP family intramembrane metalloprotease [Propionicimonas sp.]|uniref:CPBP family intramembrane glutamic endopeptidase n=1 Tax=Propionicimonas sp. TaxID=1955623 RepID=UPI003D0F987E